MGYLARKEVREVPISLSYTDAQNYLKKFKAFDRDGDGHIRYMHAWGSAYLVTDCHYFLSPFVTELCHSDLSCLCSVLDLRKVLTEIEEDEFLQVCTFVYRQQPHGTVQWSKVD